jgi:hypothetical protein
VRHKVFVPVLAGWAAALGGLSVLMLPGAVFASLLITTGLAALDGLARPVLALIAAAVCGLAGFVAALALRRSLSPDPRGHILGEVAARRIHPIDPTSELGSESLDAPLDQGSGMDLSEHLRESLATTTEPDGEDSSPDWGAHWLQEEPFELGENHALGGEAGEDAAASDAAGECEPLPEAPIAQPAPEPRDMVWTIGSEAEVAPAPEPDAPLDPVPLEEPQFDQPQPAPANGIERLRQARPEDLSLVELVERFAAALHDHQLNARRRAAADQARTDGEDASVPARDAALAEALKALSQFTQGDAETESSEGEQAGQSASRVGNTERALRNALAHLQDMRGAA